MRRVLIMIATSVLALAVGYTWGSSKNKESIACHIYHSGKEPLRSNKAAAHVCEATADPNVSLCK